MTREEYFFSNCENRHSLFTFKDGRKVSGVINSFIINKPESYQLVTTDKMLDFKKFMDKRDYENMKTLYEEINLSDIDSVEELPW